MIRSVLSIIIDDLSRNPRTGFLGFLLSFAVSLFPSLLPVSVICDANMHDQQLFMMDITLKIIQMAAGLLGVALSGIMIYINYPKLKERFRNRKEKKSSKSSDNQN
jgi:hypothetical protein